MCRPPIPKEFTCQFTIPGSCSVVPPELLRSVLACWLAQPGVIAGAGTIAGGIKFGSLRQSGIPRHPLGDRRIARGAGHRGPGDRIARVIGLNAPAVSRSVLAVLAVVLKLRMFGRSVLAGLAVVLKLRMFGRSVLVGDLKARTFGRSVRVVLVVVLKFRVVGLNAPVRVRSLRTFGRSAPVVLVRLLKSQAFDLNGLQLVPRILVVQCVLVVHNDPAMQLAQVAGIGIRLVRVRVSPRDNNPAMQRGRVVDIVTISQRGKRSRRRDLGRWRRREPERSPARDKETRASAIALRGEGDLSRSENARCQTLASG